MSGVFLLVEIDKNEPHVFAFDPQLQNAHLSGSCLSSHSAPPTGMHVMSTTPARHAHRLQDSVLFPQQRDLFFGAGHHPGELQIE